MAVADYPGDVVLINLWGQWCGPCRAEIDDLQRLQEKYEARGFTNIGVNLRDPNRQKPVDFIKDNGVTYPSIWD
ncbi:TlpA family protein disulfide reductase, partial [Mycobacterium tuberculosis]|nr:TlpA family protein disulfide reductase [Mycobacterium tuberculosis]